MSLGATGGDALDKRNPYQLRPADVSGSRHSGLQLVRMACPWASGQWKAGWAIAWLASLAHRGLGAVISDILPHLASVRAAAARIQAAIHARPAWSSNSYTRDLACLCIYTQVDTHNACTPLIRADWTRQESDEGSSERSGSVLRPRYTLCTG